jgi:WXG100 family type VII secretion target
MTGEMLVVNFAALSQAGTDIQSALNSMRSQLTDLETSAKPLVSTWSGDAKTAYEQRQRTWQQGAADLAQMLAAIKRAVDESAQDYLETERKNASMFGG